MSSKLLKNTLFLSIGSFLTKGLNLVMIPFFSSWMTTDGYGLFDLYSTYITLLLPLTTFSCNNAIFRFTIDRNGKEERKSYVSTGLAIHLVLGGIAIIVILLYTVYTEWTLGYVFSLFFLAELINKNLEGFLRGIKRLDLFSFSSVITTCVIAISVTILVRFMNMELTGMILGYAIGFFVGDIFTMVCSKYWEYVDYRKVSLSKAKTLVKYSAPLVPNGISWWIVNVSDRALINIFLGPVANGIYAISSKLPNFCTSIFGVFNLSWQEAAVEAINDKYRIEFYNLIFNKVVIFLSILCCVVLSLNQVTFERILDDRYYEGVLYTPILFLSIIFLSISQFFGGIQISEKNTRANGLSTMIGAVVNVAINLVLIKKWGLYAAAFSTLISIMVICLIRYFQISKFFKLWIQKRTYIYIIMVFYYLCICLFVKDLFFLFLHTFVAVLIMIYFNREIIRNILFKVGIIRIPDE